MDRQKRFLESAAFYLGLGFSIFPLEPGEKRPVIRRNADGSPVHKRNAAGEVEYEEIEDPVTGEKQQVLAAARYAWEKYKTQYPTMDDVHRWLAAFGDRINLAIVCGATSGIAVVDVDGNVGKEHLVRYHPELAAGDQAIPIQSTPHGWHLIFRHPGPEVKVTGSTAIFGEGSHVDIRADGNYICAVP